MKEMKLGIPVVDGDGIAGEEIVASGYGDGIMYTVPKIDLSDGFKDKIKSLAGFKNLKISIVVSLSYDASNILFSAIRKGGTNSKKIKNNLTKTSYKGESNPLIKFDKNGDLKNANYEVKIIKNKKSVLFNQ